MGILDSIVTKIEQQAKFIGKIDCTKESVSNILIGMLNSMGMVNPTGLAKRSKKGISLKKKGNLYTLTLSMYEPPLELTWTENITSQELIAKLDKMIEERKKIGAMNVFKMANGATQYQLAIN